MAFGELSYFSVSSLDFEMVKITNILHRRRKRKRKRYENKRNRGSCSLVRVVDSAHLCRGVIISWHRMVEPKAQVAGVQIKFLWSSSIHGRSHLRHNCGAIV